MVLDTVLTPALVNEGHARQLSRWIQDVRRATSLDVTDRISLTIDTDADVRGWLEPHTENLAAQVLATEFAFGQVGSTEFTYELDGHSITFKIQKS